MPPEIEWKTIKIPLLAYNQAKALGALIARRGTDSLPAGLRELSIESSGIGATVALALAALEQVLAPEKRRGAAPAKRGRRG